MSYGLLLFGNNKAGSAVAVDADRIIDINVMMILAGSLMILLPGVLILPEPTKHGMKLVVLWQMNTAKQAGMIIIGSVNFIQTTTRENVTDNLITV